MLHKIWSIILIAYIALFSALSLSVWKRHACSDLFSNAAFIRLTFYQTFSTFSFFKYNVYVHVIDSKLRF